MILDWMILPVERLQDWWAARLRKMDTDALWPVICEQSESEEQARAIFYVHAMHDPSWRRLDLPDMVARIQALRYPTYVDNPVDK